MASLIGLGEPTYSWFGEKKRWFILVRRASIDEKEAVSNGGAAITKGLLQGGPSTVPRVGIQVA